MLDQPAALLAALHAIRPHVTVIHNPTSGRRDPDALRQFVDAAIARDLTVRVWTTARPGDAEALATKAATDGSTDVLVVAGGDGTINEAINGLSGVAAPPLALLPLGTANVLAAEIGAARSPAALVEDIIRMTGDPTPRPRMFVARANGRRFAMMAGVGFDAHVVAAVDQRIKRLIGKAAYLAAFVRTMMHFGRRRYRVVVDGVAYEAASLVIANGHFYAGRFSCAPQARLDEAELHVCLFLRSGGLSALRYGQALVRGRLHDRDDVRILRAHHVHVACLEPEPVQCDGDLATELPLDVQATGEVLQLIVPTRACTAS